MMDTTSNLGIGAIAAACRNFLSIYDKCTSSDDLTEPLRELHRVLAPTATPSP
jgi:hypothetical protein